jgi:transposase InsO family protein
MDDLKRKIVDELHKPARVHFPRRNTVVKGINDLYQADLIEMKPHSRINKGFKYILTIINCFTKVADALPLKDKKGKSVAEAMEIAIKRDKNKIKHLQTDDGKEYFNKDFAALMKKYKINHYSTKSEVKAAIIERFNRTLKGAMYKMFSRRGSYVWYDMLPDLISEYNNKFHRTIGMKPIQVNRKNAKKVLKRIKKKQSLK